MYFLISICICFYSSFAVATLVPVPAQSFILSQNVTFLKTVSGLSQSSNRTSATAWPPVYPGFPYFYNLDPPDPSGLETLAFWRYGRTGGPATFDLLLTLLAKIIEQVDIWTPGSHLEGEINYRMPESPMAIIVTGYKPYVHGYEALTKERLIAVVDALRSCVSAYGSREFTMVPWKRTGRGKTRLGIVKLEGPFPDEPD